MKKVIFLSIISVVAVLVSCSKPLNQSLIHEGGNVLIRSEEKAEFHFLNVGCFILKVGDEVILNDPFLSNHSMGKLLFGNIKSDTELIDSILQKSNIANASVTLIGHGHYDHVMDVKAFEKHIIHPENRVMASTTVKQMIAPMQLKSKVIEIESQSAHENNSSPAWEYSANQKIRVMGLYSWHPPHIMGKVLFSKPLKKKPTSPPAKLKHYKLGQPLMFLVDVLDDNQKILFRTFIQTSSEKHFHNYIPQNIWEEKSTDLAVVGLAMNSKRIGYAQELVSSVKPSSVILCHWENFFKPYGYRKKGVKKSDIEFNYNMVKKALPGDVPVIMPAHNSKLIFQ